MASTRASLYANLSPSRGRELIVRNTAILAATRQWTTQNTLSDETLTYTRSETLVEPNPLLTAKRRAPDLLVLHWLSLQLPLLLAVEATQLLRPLLRKRSTTITKTRLPVPATRASNLMPVPLYEWRLCPKLPSLARLDHVHSDEWDSSAMPRTLVLPLARSGNAASLVVSCPLPLTLYEYDHTVAYPRSL